MQALIVAKSCQPRVKNRLTLQGDLPMILRCTRDGYTQQRIATLLGVTKQAVSKLMKLLIKHEYIRLEIRSSCNIYEILPRGQLILSGGNNLFKSGIGRLHNLRFKYSILAGEIPLDRWKKVEMINWNKYVGEVYGIKVEISKKSIIVSPGIFFGYKMAELLPKAEEVANSIAGRLREWYHLELAPAQSVGQPEWAVITPLPPLSLSVSSLRHPNSWLDASRGMAEVEFTDMDRAQKFIDMPNRIEKLEAELKEHRRITEGEHQSTSSQLNDNHKSTISSITETHSPVLESRMQDKDQGHTPRFGSIVSKATPTWATLIPVQAFEDRFSGKVDCGDIEYSI